MAKLTASFTALLEMLAPVIRSTCWSRVMVSAGRPVYWLQKDSFSILVPTPAVSPWLWIFTCLMVPSGSKATMTTTVELYPLSLLVMMVPTPLSAV